jgi:TRAP-type C4-dicarboxylate transport system permease small subunit
MTFIDKLSEGVARALIWVLFTVALLSWMEVTLRYVFRSPTVWAPEIIAVCSASVFLFAGSIAMSRNLHIRITILHDILPGAGQRVVAALSLLAALVFIGGLGYGAWNQFVNSVWRFSGDTWTPEMTGRAWNVPLPPLTRALLVLAAALLIAQALVTYGRQILGMTARTAAPSDRDAPADDARNTETRDTEVKL